MKTVTIKPVLNGFVVTVGCSEIVFKRMEDLCDELVRYQRHPEQVEQEYMAGAVNHVGPTTAGIGIPMTVTASFQRTHDIHPPMPIVPGECSTGPRQI